MSIWDKIDQSQKTVSQAILSDLSEMVRRLGEPLASTGKSRRENGNKLRKTRIRATVGDQTEQKILLLISQFDSAWSKLSGAINYAKYLYNHGGLYSKKNKEIFCFARVTEITCRFSCWFRHNRNSGDELIIVEFYFPI